MMDNGCNVLIVRFLDLTVGLCDSFAQSTSNRCKQCLSTVS